ncbi:hypothetical protein Bca4012_057247 [Brassica carinata]
MAMNTAGERYLGTVEMAEAPYMTAKTSVWWDIENCQISRGFDAHGIAQNISSALLKVNYCGPVSVYAYGDVTRIPNPSDHPACPYGQSSTRNFYADLRRYRLFQCSSPIKDETVQYSLGTASKRISAANSCCKDSMALDKPVSWRHNAEAHNLLPMRQLVVDQYLHLFDRTLIAPVLPGNVLVVGGHAVVMLSSNFPRRISS